MASATAKRERLEARISEEEKALLQRAADLEGRSLTDFVVRSAAAAARATIQAHQITLSARDSRRFVDALLNPPAPNDCLRAAAQRYQRFVQS